MKKAFTLAEVLITLTIIGVIAALTIPNLMQSYKKHQVEAGIKEAYSILSNAIKMSVAENGELTRTQLGSSYWATEPYVEKYLLPYLKTGKICGFANGYKQKVLNKGCFISSDNYYWSWNYLDGRNSNGNDTGIYQSKNFCAFILSNGMHVAVLVDPTSDYIVYVVDINGSNGSTTAGKDVFFYTLSFDDWQKLYTGTYPSFTVARLTYNNNCTLTGLGTTCAYRIARNGWRIPDNYPVKKF